MKDNLFKNLIFPLTFISPSTIYLGVSNQFNGNRDSGPMIGEKMRERKAIDTRLQKIHNAMGNKKQGKNRIEEFCHLIEKEAEHTLIV